MCQMEIITVFMLINGLDVGIMMAFYNAGGTNIDTLMRLSTFLHQMRRLYDQTEHSELLSRFGYFYAYHLESRELRYVNGSRHFSFNTQRQGYRFVPDSPAWERLRNVRRAIRSRTYLISDDYDLSVLRASMQDGLLRMGRKH